MFQHALGFRSTQVRQVWASSLFQLFWQHSLNLPVPLRLLMSSTTTWFLRIQQIALKRYVSGSRHIEKIGFWSTPVHRLSSHDCWLSRTLLLNCTHTYAKGEASTAVLWVLSVLYIKYFEDVCMPTTRTRYRQCMVTKDQASHALV